MLYTHTVEKLQALRLEGMVQALEEQRRQSEIVALDFEDRLALLVERQWLWRENRGLASRLKNAQFKISARTNTQRLANHAHQYCFFFWCAAIPAA